MNEIDKKAGLKLGLVIVRWSNCIILILFKIQAFIYLQLEGQLPLSKTWSPYCFSFF